MRHSSLRGAFKVFLPAALLFIWTTAAAFGASPDAGSATGPREYVIGAQNVLQIKIFGEGSTNQIYRVDEGGSINHALVGRTQLAGKTIAEAEQILEKKLAGDYIINPHVTIFVLEFSRFSIIGEVVRPGSYEITGHVSVIEAVSMAGGFTRVANPGDVRIVRKSEGKESAIKVDTRRITERGDMSAEVSIQAEDVIVVGKSFF